MVGDSGSLRGRLLLLAAVVSLAGTIAATCLLQQADAARPGASSHRLLLRLHDLPPGYLGNLVSAETGPLDECGYLQPADAQPKLATFIDRYSPKGCFGIYLRLYRVPGATPAPPAVGTGALDAGSVEAAEAGLAIAPEAIGHLAFEMDLEEAAPVETIGDASRLFHWRHPASLFAPGHPSDSFLAWRSGSVVGVVFVEAHSQAAADRIANELAHRQQTHIEQPTPYTRAEQYDTEVPLDDPSLRTPVFWLGRRFVFGDGLPTVRLQQTWAHPTPFLGYSHGLDLRVWKLRKWRHLRSALDLSNRTRHCATRTKVTLSLGYAVIYGTHRHAAARCPNGPPNLYLAQAHIGRAVVVVETHATCAVCTRSGAGPFNSLHGMKSVVHHLRLRPRTTF